MQGMKAAMSMTVIQAMMDAEPKKRKQGIACMGFGAAVICLIFAALYLARAGSVGNFQTWSEDNNPYHDDDTVVYDVGCLIESSRVDPDNLAGWSAYVAVGTAAVDECDMDEDCIKRGTQWSTLFVVNGILYICLMINMICVGIGAWKAWARLFGAVCAFPMWCFNFAMLIVTATFRFRAYGKACALNEQYTNMTCSDADCINDVDDTWTYMKDGALIMGIFIVAILNCCACFSCATRPIGKPRDGMMM